MYDIGLVYYFCGLSGKWHLDWCRLFDLQRPTGHTARVDRVWHSKVTLHKRIVLGDGLKAFKSKSDLEAFAPLIWPAKPIPYEPIIDTGLTKWIKS